MINVSLWVLIIIGMGHAESIYFHDHGSCLLAETFLEKRFEQRRSTDFAKCFALNYGAAVGG